jgi:hypothetical protein
MPCNNVEASFIINDLSKSASVSVLRQATENLIHLMCIYFEDSWLCSAVGRVGHWLYAQPVGISFEPFTIPG